MGSVRGTWYGDAGGWTAAHETGHLMGESDHYYDSMVDGKTTMSVPHEGYDQNMMGFYGGMVEQKNIDSILDQLLNPSDKAKCTCGQ